MSTALAIGHQAWISARVLWSAPFVVRFRGVLQALLATLLLAALMSWNPADPSLNAASTEAPTNWLGMNGAMFADLFMQTLGLAAWPAALLLIAFAVMMLFTAWAMIRPKKTQPAAAPSVEASADVEPRRHPLGKILLEGVVVGFVTGIIGAGGGFLVVPALVLLGGLPMSAAVGTSLLVIAMKSFAGLGGYLTSVTLPWDLLLWVTGVAVVGGLIGVPLVKRVPEKALKKGFGWFVLAMGLVIFWIGLSDFGSLFQALASEAFLEHRGGGAIKRVIVVPGRLVNVVVA